MSEKEQAITSTDPMDKVIANMAAANTHEPEEPRVQTEEPEIAAPETPPVEEQTPVVASEVAPEVSVEITQEKEIEIFNKLTGLNVKTIDEVNEYSGVVSKWPEYKKTVELYPTLVEKLKTSQDVMQYFPDDATFKVAQLSKDEKYKGREAELTKVLKSDVSQMSEMDVVKLYAGLNSPAGVKNPFRYTIKKMGLDPDEVIESFSELNEDDKDLFNGFAAQARKELSQIGSDIQVPKSSVDDIEALLREQADFSRDDIEKKRSTIAPVSSAIVDEIKEFKIADDFSFKLNLTANDKKDYAEFLTEAVLSGDFDVSSDEGKRGLYNALMDEIWVDNREKILKAYESDIRTKLEKEFREKYNNEKPLSKETPPPITQKTKVSPMAEAIHGMIGEFR